MSLRKILSGSSGWAAGRPSERARKGEEGSIRSSKDTQKMMERGVGGGDLRKRRGGMSQEGKQERKL
jgi:hypothetical protein